MTRNDDDEYGNQHRAFVQGEYLSYKIAITRHQEISNKDLDRFRSTKFIVHKMCNFVDLSFQE